MAGPSVGEMILAFMAFCPLCEQRGVSGQKSFSRDVTATPAAGTVLGVVGYVLRS
jgi:hypothetical protein